MDEPEVITTARNLIAMTSDHYEERKLIFIQALYYFWSESYAYQIKIAYNQQRKSLAVFDKN